MTRKQLEKFVEPFTLTLDVSKCKVVNGDKDVYEYRFEYDRIVETLEQIFDSLYESHQINTSTHIYSTNILTCIMLAYEM